MEHGLARGPLGCVKQQAVGPAQPQGTVWSQQKHGGLVLNLGK